MKKYRYIFHFGSGQIHVMNTLKQIDLTKHISQPWIFIYDSDIPNFCNNGGAVIHVDDIEFIEVVVIDEK